MPLDAVEPTSDFIDFPPRERVVELLREVDDSGEEQEELYVSVADRLGGRTYERSASAFILIEILYEYEETRGGDMSYLLPRFVLALTRDRDLALSALGAFNEIKDAIQLHEPEKAFGTASLELPEVPEAPPEPEEPSDLDLMMLRLQTAQKSLADLGLTTRVSIDLASRRPTRERVSRTLQDIASLRATLRRFEELLSQAELVVLEAAGVLWEDGKGGKKD